MTAPNETRAGATYLVTRRVTRRHFLLRPDADATLQFLYWYFTALFAAQLGIIIHSVQVVSTHMHEVVTDTRGNLPRFYELRNRMVANAIKCHRGWAEEVLNKSGPSYVELLTPESIVKEIAYTTVNCVAAFLVRSPRKWPGAKVLVEDIGRKVIRAPRPTVYIDPTNPQWPEEVELRIEMPVQLIEEYGSEEAARRVIQSAVDEKIKEAHAEAKALGRSFLGAKRALRVPFTRRANSWERFGARYPRFSAAGNEAATAAWLKRRYTFVADYRESLEQLKQGEPDVVFPYGTWKMRYHYRVRCRPPPD